MTPAPDTPKTPAEQLLDIERQQILDALRESGGVIAGATGAAARLGIKRTTLQSTNAEAGNYPPVVLVARGSLRLRLTHQVPRRHQVPARRRQAPPRASMNQSSTEQLKKTPLNARHRAHGARMVPFGGWDMPVEYSGIVNEHLAVRTKAGLFDVSHMGEIELAGKDALAAVQKISANDAAN